MKEKKQVQVIGVQTGLVYNDFTLQPNEQIVTRTKEQLNKDKNYGFYAEKKLKGYFSKMFDDTIRVIAMSGIGKIDLLVLDFLIKNTEAETNLCVIENRKLEQKDLVVINKSIETIKRAFKKLKQHNFIGYIKTPKGYYWAINPNLFQRGETTYQGVVKYFSDKEFNKKRK